MYIYIYIGNDATITFFSQEGDLLSFDMLELNGWSPEFVLKEAVVVHYDSNTNMLTMKIEEPFLSKKKNNTEQEEDYQEEDEEEEDEVSDILEIERTNLANIRLIARKQQCTPTTTTSTMLTTSTTTMTT